MKLKSFNLSTALLLIGLTGLLSCSRQDKRVELLQKELNINLPSNYVIDEDKDITDDAFTGDHTVTIELKFDKNSMDSVINQIKNVPYYNELERFRTGVKVGDDIQYYEVITDSMSQSKFRGSWFETDIGYEFIDLTDFEKPANSLIKAKIQVEKSVLTFVYIDM